MFPVRIAPFRIERFYDAHEFTTRFMLSSSDCESWSVADLLALDPGAEERLLSLRLGYTESPGSPQLREAISLTYEGLTADDVLVLAAAEEGIFTLYHALLGPGDHAVVETPCYESALEALRSAGCEVSTWTRRFDDGWAHDRDALRSLLRPSTRLLYVNTPHNPTGTQMSRATFDAIVELARERGLILFADEVYRDLQHEPARQLPAACEVYERAHSLGSVSKSYGLPGLRLGWLASRDRALLRSVLELKYYTTICSSAPGELLTELALRHRETLVERNVRLVRDNLLLLDEFFERRADRFAWVRPQAGPIGFPRLLSEPDADGFCARVAEQADVLLLPGSVYDQPQHMRVGFGRANMPEALARLDALLDRG
jgi:aspartate/methionine/tyrosine aminotransferase